MYLKKEYLSSSGTTNLHFPVGEAVIIEAAFDDFLLVLEEGALEAARDRPVHVLVLELLQDLLGMGAMHGRTDARLLYLYNLCTNMECILVHGRY